MADVKVDPQHFINADPRRNRRDQVRA